MSVCVDPSCPWLCMQQTQPHDKILGIVLYYILYTHNIRTILLTIVINIIIIIVIVKMIMMNQKFSWNWLWCEKVVNLRLPPYTLHSVPVQHHSSAAVRKQVGHWLNKQYCFRKNDVNILFFIFIFCNLVNQDHDVGMDFALKVIAVIAICFFPIGKCYVLLNYFKNSVITY